MNWGTTDVSSWNSGRKEKGRNRNKSYVWYRRWKTKTQLRQKPSRMMQTSGTLYKWQVRKMLSISHYENVTVTMREMTHFPVHCTATGMANNEKWLYKCWQSASHFYTGHYLLVKWKLGWGCNSVGGVGLMQESMEVSLLRGEMEITRIQNEVCTASTSIHLFFFCHLDISYGHLGREHKLRKCLHNINL